MSEGRRFERPGSFVVTCFAGLIGIGTALLALPVSHTAAGGGVSVSDAFFTAASAVTVTGLVVVDTGTVWSPFGELVLLALIQIGGLGIMTMAGFLGIFLTRRLKVRSGLMAGVEIGTSDLGVLRLLIRDLVAFVLISEVVVAALVTLRILSEGGNSWTTSLHQGVFHSVSAFNNAGFSIFDGGMERYVDDWYMNVVITGAFILGGLGFPVVFELVRDWRKPRFWSLHTKVTLAVTVALLASGTVAIAIIEWSNPATLGPHSAPDRLLAAYFQSATARTAGFNTIPIGAMYNASWLVLIPLMVVGAGSASTGGGIKTSTLAIVVRSAMAELQGRDFATLTARKIPLVLERQALALVVSALAAVGSGTFLLSIFHPDLSLAELLFEAASAFGTAGMSTGLTEELDQIGRAVVIGLMFLGRVGPITFGTAMLLRGRARRYGYAEESLMLG